MNIVFGVAGSALMYELCKVHKILIGHEKCAKSMEKMYNTIKQCPQCSKALHDHSQDCVMMNDFVPQADTTKDSAYNSEACGNQNQTNSVCHTEPMNNANETKNHFEPWSTSTLKSGQTPYVGRGKITKNKFFNYCRENRAKRLGQQQTIIIKESAFKWKQFTRCDKMNYSFSAVNLREKNLPSTSCNMTN